MKDGYFSTNMDHIIQYCRNHLSGSYSKLNRIENALKELQDTGIRLTMDDFIGMGGYNICFRNPNRPEEVIRIYFQSNITDATDVIVDYYKLSSNVVLPILHYGFCKAYGKEFLYSMTPLVVSLTIVASPEMAKELHKTSVAYFDYMLDNLID